MEKQKKNGKANLGMGKSIFLKIQEWETKQERK